MDGRVSAKHQAVNSRLRSPPNLKSDFSQLNGWTVSGRLEPYVTSWFPKQPLPHAMGNASTVVEACRAEFDHQVDWRNQFMTEALLTASEVAQLLKLNIETVYTLIREEGLPAAKIRGQWRLVEADVQCWVKARTQDASASS